MKFDRLLLVVACLLFPARWGTTQTVPNLTNQPITFEPNQGQSSPGVSYLAHHRSYGIRINESSFAYVIPAADLTAGVVLPSVLTLRWEGAAKSAQLTPESLQPGISNYFTGKDASRWITKVPHYSELKETGLLPGVDLRYHSNPDGDLEYDLIVAPNTDLVNVKFSVEGADQVRLCEAGALCLKVGGAELRQLPPHAFEMRGGKKVELDAAYVLKSGNQVSFAAPGHLPANQLVIDPVIQYATYLGGSKSDSLPPWTWGINTAVDPLGNIFIAGMTNTVNVPVTPGTIKNPCYLGDCSDAAYFITKFSASGQLLYSTYLFAGYQMWYAAPGKTLAVDSTGHAYLAGWGSNIPTTTNAFQLSCYTRCSFLVKLEGDGSGFQYSTYLGGSNSIANAIAFGPTGDVYVAGQTKDIDMTTTPGAYEYACPLNKGGACNSGYLARFNTNLSGPASLVFSTYLGAFGGDSSAAGVAVDLYGDAYVVGVANADFPNQAIYGSGTAPKYVRGIMEIDAGETYVAKLDGSYGQMLRPVTILRGAAGAAIAVDNGLNTFVTGAANAGLVTSPGAFQQSFGGKWTDAFVTKIDLDGYLQAATFLGGSQDDVATDIALNAYDMPFITGSTYSTDFPLGPGGFGKTSAGFSAFFVGAFSADLSNLNTSSYWSGSNSAWASGIALDPAGNLYVTGATYATNLPVSPNAFQLTPPGQLNAFVTRIVFAGDLRATVKPSVTSIAKNGLVTYNAQITNLGPDTSNNVVVSDSIPAGMSYAGVSAPNGNGCKQPKVGATAGTLTCTRTLLPKGQTYYVNIYLRAFGKSRTKVTNKVSVAAQTQDLWPANNSASSTISIK